MLSHDAYLELMVFAMREELEHDPIQLHDQGLIALAYGVHGLEARWAAGVSAQVAIAAFKALATLKETPEFAPSNKLKVLKLLL